METPRVVFFYSAYSGRIHVSNLLLLRLFYLITNINFLPSLNLSSKSVLHYPWKKIQQRSPEYLVFPSTHVKIHVKIVPAGLKAGFYVTRSVPPNNPWFHLSVFLLAYSQADASTIEDFKK